MTALASMLGVMRHHRMLIWEMTRREIRDRYAGQVFGALWALGHPIFLMLLYIVVFNIIFAARVGGSFALPRDLTTYILAGLIPWLTFQDVLARSPTVITGNANLVKQIVFPVEVLPVKTVLAVLPNLLVGVGVLIVYELVRNQSLPWTYLLFPLLAFVLLLAMVAVSLIFSAVGVYFRDLKDVVMVFNAANLFMTPILFLPGVIPSSLAWVFYLNPFSYMVWCYQDIFYFGRFEHPWAWGVFSIGSILILVLGCRIFLRLKAMFGNVL